MVTKDIIEQCIDNSRLAQENLYKSCAPYAYAIVKNYISDTHFRKDALQEVFAELFKSLRSFDENRGSFKSWLSSMTVHTCINLQRKQLKIHDGLTVDDMVDIAVSPTAELSEKELERAHLILKDMPQGYKTIFLLNQVEEYSHEKIARLLDIKPETSRSQLNRAKYWIKKNVRSLHLL